MAAWSDVVGLFLVTLGALTLGWALFSIVIRERRAPFAATAGPTIIVVGTLLQIAGSWPGPLRGLLSFFQNVSGVVTAAATLALAGLTAFVVLYEGRKLIDELRERFMERKPLIFLERNTQGCHVIRNVGSGPAINVFFIAIDQAPTNCVPRLLGSLPANQELKLPGDLQDSLVPGSDVWKCVLAAEGLPRTRRWNPTLNVGTSGAPVFHRTPDLGPSARIGDDLRWTFLRFWTVRGPTVCSQIDDLATEYLQIVKRRSEPPK